MFLLESSPDRTKSRKRRYLPSLPLAGGRAAKTDHVHNMTDLASRIHKEPLS